MSKPKISYTAWVILLCQIALKKTQRWHTLVPDNSYQFYQSVFSRCRHHNLIFYILSLFPPSWYIWLIEFTLAKGAPLHFVLRKKAIAEQLEECIVQGVAQLVVIGGGFDPLAMHTAQRHPEMICFEIDTEPMLTLKTIANQTLPGNFYMVGTDLTESSLYNVLLAHPAYSKDRKTIFIAEGITMYLREQDIIRLLESIRQLISQSTTFMFSAIERKKDRGGLGTLLRKIYLSFNDEHFSWGIPSGDMAVFLSAHGFKQRYLTAYVDLQEKWRFPEELEAIKRENGEYLILAESEINPDYCVIPVTGMKSNLEIGTC